MVSEIGLPIPFEGGGLKGFGKMLSVSSFCNLVNSAGTYLRLLQEILNATKDSSWSISGGRYEILLFTNEALSFTSATVNRGTYSRRGL